LVLPQQARPYGGNEERSADGYKPEKENYNDWMLLMHQVVAQSRAPGRDAAIGEAYVQNAQALGDMKN
jgi:hypothetical protein